MAWTNMNGYMSIIFMAVVVISSLGYLGSSFVSSDRVDLSEDSLDYILTIQGQSVESGIEGIATTESSESHSTNVLTSEDDTEVSDANDFLSTLNIKKERASRPTNLLKYIYNIPTTLVVSLGLPLQQFNHIINIFGYLLSIGIIVIIWVKFVRS